jgi:hypothetical protein
MKKPLYHVTDHAIVRYLERVEGMDVEALRRRIGHTVQDGIELGANGVVSGGYVYRIEGVSVVTIAPQNEVDRGRKKRRGRKPRE